MSNEIPIPGSTPANDRRDRSAAGAARTDQVQLPNPPAVYPQLGRGASQADAVQHAEREVASGAIDDAGMSAGAGPLPYERIRDAGRRIEHSFIAGQQAETEGVGEALVNRAKRGEFTDRPATLQNASMKGAKAERKALKADVRDAAAEHSKASAVLDGSRPDAKGCRRPGDPIASDVVDTTVLRRRLRRAAVVEWIPPVLLLLVEGAVVAGNMRAYLRADDSDLFTPLAIAVVTVAILTLAPFFIGRLANDAAHGRTLSIVHRAAMLASGVFWIGAAVMLAVIRTSVDRAEAIAKAQDAEYDRVAAARALGQTVEAVPVDPDTVFNPVVPTLFWATVFIGFGVVMVLIEIATHNPARADELARRIALIDAKHVLNDAVEYGANLKDTVVHQRNLAVTATRQWQHEAGIADAAADLDVATHLQALAQHAGSPEMLLAIERRASTRGVPAASPVEAGSPAAPPQATAGDRDVETERSR